jgi:hypothetical protein
MRFILFVSLIVASSCGLGKKKPVSFKVTGKIEVHKPYCGGARPNPDQLKGYFEAYPNTTFYIKKSMNNDPKLETVAQFTTDENGAFSIEIPAGNYIGIHADKVLSFDDYVEKLGKTTDKFFEYIGEKDAKFQHQHIDFILDVQADKTFNYAYKSKCFTGLNPLIKYTGPKPI